MVFSERAVKSLVGNVIYSLSLIKFSFDLGQMLSQALGPNLVNKPKVLLILNLIYQSSD